MQIILLKIKFITRIIWYRKQRRKWFLTGVNASAAAPFLGEVAKPILKKIFGSQRRRQRSKKK